MKRRLDRMTATTRIVAFVIAALLVVGAAYAIGRNSSDHEHHPNSSTHHMNNGASMHDTDASGTMAGSQHGSMDSMPGMEHGTPSTMGLSDTGNGMALKLGQSDSQVGTPWTEFKILDRQGQPVTEYDIEYSKPMHVIVVRNDLVASSYEHLHPTLAGDGTWSVRTPYATPGTYRFFADFTPKGGDRTVLADTVTVAGTAPARAKLPRPTTRVMVDGYRVDVGDTLTAGKEGTLTLRVTKDGKPVTLEPLLGTYGHAVLLRSPDLAYLHVHPDASNPQQGTITFATTLPTAAIYAAFVQFQAGGTSHTTPFTIDAPSPGSPHMSAE